MLEAELAFTSTLDELLDVVEDGVRSTCRRLMWETTNRAKRMRSDLEVVASHLLEEEGAENVVGGTGTELDCRADRPPLLHLLNAASRGFKRITYTSAISLLSSVHDEVGFVHQPTWGEGISTEQEKWLAAHFGGPVFVTHYPRSIKPFYMLPSSADPSHKEETPRETVACFDLLFPGIGEMAGGSLREYRLEPLGKAMDDAGMQKEGYRWYLDLRRYGSVPHGGWGMGWDRWVCWVTGVSNVRDVVAFPRWKGHCKY
jgi:asparaginyl-tRNA synthetase